MRITTCLLAITVFALGVDEVSAQIGSDMGSGSGSSRSSRSSRRSSDSSSTGNDKNQPTTGEQSRSRDRRDSDRSRNSSTRRGDANTKGSPTPAPGAKTPEGKKDDKKTVSGKKPASSGGSGGGQKPTTNVEFKMQLDPQQVSVLYLESSGDQPSLNIQAIEKKKFITRLVFYNPRQAPFTLVKASLKYDPAVLRPIGIDDDAVSASLAQPSSVTVDRRRGIIYYKAEFENPQTDSLLNVARLEWESLTIAPDTQIAFLNGENYESGVFNADGENVLHGAGDSPTGTSAKTGLLNASVSIDASEGTLQSIEERGNSFSAIALATNINEGTAEGGIELALRPRKAAVGAGGTVLVDVVYRNPKRADVDTVKLKVRFDPKVLRVVDHDDNNWITRDTNIYDGLYHEDLPFDFHRRNLVYNETGVILYEMGFSTRTVIPAEGTIATIRFEALQPTAETVIAFDAAGQGESGSQPKWDTSLSFLGFNLIGVPGRREEFLKSASIIVSGY